jgi:tRNA threonylcarbamoyladenosine biosynthesis protein TsaB
MEGFDLKILALDTATEICSVAILDDDNMIDAITINSTNSHSVELMPIISNIMSRNNLTLNDIDLFACDNGPGSFTGIRIGIATIKAFCDVTNKPCIGVSSLDGFSIKNPKNNCIICSLINAKHNNCYCGLFTYSNNKLEKYQDYFFDSFSNILLELENLEKKVFFVGNCGDLFKDIIANSSIEDYEIYFDSQISAVDIGKVAFYNYENTTNNTSRNLIPIYLK